jgi:hypothetical protein
LLARFFDEKHQPAVQRKSRERLFSKLLFYTLSLFERLANFIANFIHDADSSEAHPARCALYLGIQLANLKPEGIRLSHRRSETR